MERRIGIRLSIGCAAALSGIYLSPLCGSVIDFLYAITRPDGRAYVLTTRYAGLSTMERRIPIRRHV
ncbi:MAG: hypothetical protein K2G15_01185 [Muribaculaceae bacterium]|nr:hypothetical protein [Muribaculaceae bacterium]